MHEGKRSSWRTTPMNRIYEWIEALLSRRQSTREQMEFSSTKELRRLAEQGRTEIAAMARDELEFRRNRARELTVTINVRCDERSSLRENYGMFDLTEADEQAIEIAQRVARILLARDDVTPRQVIGLGHALLALERLPNITPGCDCSFGVEHRVRDKESGEMRYIEVSISAEAFEISSGGSVYEASVGSDSYSDPHWRVEIDGHAEREADLSEIENEVLERLKLGAQIRVYDESDIDAD